MASKKILAQLELETVSSLTSPASGFVGFSAKADGLYQKIGTDPELRLLTSADVQNAILADGSITGAVSQAQIFTMGVKLSNLTQGYIPYASGTTKLLSNSPIYTDGTNVGIETTNPGAKLDVLGPIRTTQNSTGYSQFTHANAAESANHPRAFFNIFGGGSEANSALYIAPGNAVGTTMQPVFLGLSTNSNVKQAGSKQALFYLTNSAFSFITNDAENSGGTKIHWYFGGTKINGSDSNLSILANGNVGIGTPTPNQQLEITQNFRLPSTTGTTLYGIIYKDTTPFIHDFNYGNNGTVSTVGCNTFVGLNAGNFTMGSTATQGYEASYNTGIGYQSLFSNTIGTINTANGCQSLYSNTIGSNNTANGYGSLFYNTIGYNNTALGSESLFYNTTGINNVSLGYRSGQVIANKSIGALNSSNSIFIGYRTSPLNDDETNQIVIGDDAIGAGSNKTVIGNSSVTDTYFGSSTGASKLWASALNLSSLTASKVVFTDGSKNLTSTGIGTSSQFIKGDGSLDSNTYITSGSVSGFVPYTGATQNVNIGTFGLHSGDISIDNELIVGNTNHLSYTDGGYFNITTPQSSYAGINFYSKDTYDDFGVIQITANPEEGIGLMANSNNNSINSYLYIQKESITFYTSAQKRLEIAQSGSINAFGNTITSTGGFIGNASTATKLQTARTITVGYKTLSFDGTSDISFPINEIGFSQTRLGSNAYSYLSGDIVIQGSGKIFVNQMGQYITVNSYAYSKEDVGLSNVTNNAQWHNGSHPTTIAGYGITDAFTVSGLATNYIPKWNGTTFENSPLITNSYNNYVYTNVSFASGVALEAPYITLTDKGLNAGQSYMGFDRFSENYTSLIGAGYDAGYISILPENEDGLNVMVGSMSGARDLYVTGGTSTSSMALRSGAVTGYYLKCINTNGAAEWAPVTASQIYKGTWNASTNTPSLSNGSGVAGWYYRVTTAGTFNSVAYSVGDDIIYNGSIWERIPGAGYSLQTATTTVLGGVKIDGTSVKLNASNQLYVSTNYEAPLTFTGGLSRTGNTVSFTGSVSGFVPYTGATMNVDLGSRRLTLNDIRVTANPGQGKVLMDVTGQGHAAWMTPTPYNLPIASSTVLGGIKVGYGLYVNVDTGSLAVDTMYFVPYTGAASDVNLGSRSIFAYDFVLYSDINLKCNIESIPKHRIDIDYKQFEYKTNEGEKRYGVIAQELLSIAPEFVVKNGDYYAVKYTDLLVYEIVQLKEEIKELKSMLCR